MTPYNTRIAPSPTGDFHIGTARTAYFNYLIARATGGEFLVRIDDTDDIRNKEECVQVIYDTLEWLGLDFDATFKQSDPNNTDTYLGAAQSLINAGFAIRDSDGSVRFVWKDGFCPRVWTDRCVGDVSISDDDVIKMNGMILLRSTEKGGRAMYNFASVVDDYLQEINFICRGVDHITNTARQVAIWSALNHANAAGKIIPLPEFAHVGLIFSAGKKISKRDGAASCLKYKEDGIHPEAMLDFLLRLGWGPKNDNKETAMLTKQQAINLFLSAGNLHARNANADFNKLAAYDRKYKGRDENIRRGIVRT